MRIYQGLDEFVSMEGRHLGLSGWHQVDQDQISTFADATGDHQWIHTDPERAATGPFGRTIAHGYLTLSMLPSLMSEVYRVDGLSMALNYGLNKVRFINPVPVGSRLRVGAELLSTTSKGASTRSTVRATIEIEDPSQIACVAECVTLLIR